MFEIVTMEQVSTTKLVEPEHHKDLFAGLESHRVLPCRFMREGWSAIPLQDLEMCAKCMCAGWSIFDAGLLKNRQNSI